MFLVILSDWKMVDLKLAIDKDIGCGKIKPQ